jgi:hypothetical protein
MAVWRAVEEDIDVMNKERMIILRGRIERGVLLISVRGSFVKESSLGKPTT